MKILKSKELIIVKNKINELLKILNKYGEKHVKFYPYMQMIANNIEYGISLGEDVNGELSKTIYEDWRQICIGRGGLENWCFDISDLEQCVEINKKFEQLFLSIEQILTTNYIIKKQWYGMDELRMIGRNYRDCKKKWDDIIVQLVKANRFYDSPTDKIPDDIWSYSKMLRLVDNDDLLEKWFSKIIPEFGYLSPLKILSIEESGEDILRMLMLNMPN